jgi:hypothetical protein
VQKATRPVSRGRSAVNSIASSHSPDPNRPLLTRSHKSSGSDASVTTHSASPSDVPRDRPVVCRISTHTLRLEREFQLCKLITKQSDPTFRRFVRPIEFLRLPPKPGNSEPIAVSIVEAPGPNYLKDLVSFGPNAYKITGQDQRRETLELRNKGGIPLLTFLDFAIGATESLEILHHGHELVHGEIRGDAFHFAEDGVVKMINFGSGARSFENGLTSAGCTLHCGNSRPKLAGSLLECLGQRPRDRPSTSIGDRYVAWRTPYPMMCSTCCADCRFLWT